MACLVPELFKFEILKRKGGEEFAIGKNLDMQAVNPNLGSVCRDSMVLIIILNPCINFLSEPDSSLKRKSS